jgi:DNA-binding NarL/FixJ family response regulator
MENEKIRVVLADGHAIVREGIKRILEAEGIDIVGEAGSGQETLALVEETSADLLILGISMPDMSGIDILRKLKDKDHDFHILVLSSHSEEQYVKSAMTGGASGYVEKSATATDLLTAIHTVMSGQIYLSSKHAMLMVNAFLHTDENPDPYTILSKREIEVLKLLVRGYSLSEAGDQLGLSLKTVDTYKTRIFGKLGFSRKSEMVQYALDHGLLGAEHHDI